MNHHIPGGRWFIPCITHCKHASSVDNFKLSMQTWYAYFYIGIFLAYNLQMLFCCWATSIVVAIWEVTAFTFCSVQVGTEHIASGTYLSPFCRRQFRKQFNHIHNKIIESVFVIIFAVIILQGTLAECCMLLSDFSSFGNLVLVRMGTTLRFCPTITMAPQSTLMTCTISQNWARWYSNYRRMIRRPTLPVLWRSLERPFSINMTIGFQYAISP